MDFCASDACPLEPLGHGDPPPSASHQRSATSQPNPGPNRAQAARRAPYPRSPPASTLVHPTHVRSAQPPGERGRARTEGAPDTQSAPFAPRAELSERSEFSAPAQQTPQAKHRPPNTNRRRVRARPRSPACRLRANAPRSTEQLESCSFLRLRRRRGLCPRPDPQVEPAGAPTPTTKC
ncbi:MAG: hypothetical protein RL385_3146 [Pseudomonadota bacterium]